MKKLLTGTFYFAFLLLPTLLYSQKEDNIFKLTELKDEYFLNDHLEVLTLKKGDKRGLNEIIHATEFVPYAELQKKDVKLNRQDIHWGRVTIRNDLEELNELHNWKLFVGNANYIEVYVLDTALNTVSGPLHAGHLMPSSKKTIDYANRQLRVNLSLKGHSMLILFIKITGQNHNPTAFDLVLKKYDFNENWWYFTSRRAYWMFLGFLVTMVLFNFLMFWGTRDRAFMYHALFLFGVTIYLFEFFGIMEDAPFFKENPFYIQQCTYIMLTLMDYGYLQFVRVYMHLDKLLPKWDRIFRWMIIARIILMVFTLITFQITQNEPFTDNVTAIYMISEYLFLLFFMTVLFKTGDSKTWYLAVGTMTIVAGVVLSASSILTGGVIKATFVFIGLLGEVLFFSLGLAHRMKLLQQEELEAQRLKDLNEFKARFYTNITHEFRTPLTVIHGMSNELKEETEQLSISERAKTALHTKLEMVRRNGQNLLNLVNRILDLAKLESGHMELDLKKGDILGYLRYLTDSFNSYAKSKNIHLQFLTELDALEMNYDADKIRHILTNLISNALKFSSENDRVTVLVKTQINALSGIERLLISVKDTGIGIDEEQIKHVFERFYQADTSAKNSGQGTGIGLSLTRELVQLMNGKIEVESEAGVGTEFRVWLPIDRSTILEEPEKISEISSAPQLSKAIQRERSYELKETTLERNITDESNESVRSTILIIEDSPDIVQYLKTLLEKDYHILIAYNGSDGIEKAIDSIPDIIISDVMMPEKDGFEVCETLKNDERTNHIPIILLTARATVEDRIAGLSRGADAYLGKPFEKEELLVRLEKLIELRIQLQKRYSTFQTTSHNTKPTTVEDEFIQKLQLLIEKHLPDSTFGIPQICRGMGMSRAQLHRKITALTGKSTSIYVRSIRLFHAKNLLLTTELTISEIAYDVGFSDPNYFSRTYSEEFGETPSETRK